MTAVLSLYLDIVRLTAALVVFVHHASYERFGGAWLSAFSGFAHEAVVVFFVLSGFVIAYVVDTKENTASTYVIARFSRLWSVAIPAILGTILMDALGRALAPEVYVPGETAVDIFRITASLLFLNEWWFSHLHVGSNGPYWSLSFEGSYYLLFGLFMFIRRPWPWIIISSLLIGPKIILMMPAWIAGVIAYRQTKTTYNRQTGVVLTIVGLILALAFLVFRIGNVYITYRWRYVLGDELFDAFGHAVYFVSDTIIAAGVALHILGVAILSANVVIRKQLARMVSRASAATFPIYVIHYPALLFFTAVSLAYFGEKNSAMIFVSSAMIGIVLTPLGEFLRRWMRKKLTEI